jgi:hypothetical protein
MVNETSNPNATTSSWVAEIRYRRVNGERYLALFADRGDALLYRGVPSWVRGLLVAGKSVGRAYNRLLKARGFEYTRVTGDAVDELRAMLAG